MSIIQVLLFFGLCLMVSSSMVLFLWVLHRLYYGIWQGFFSGGLEWEGVLDREDKEFQQKLNYLGEGIELEDK